MKRTIITTCLVGLLAFAFIPYKVYSSSSDGLLIFLGLLVAALVQVIPVTANFLQSDYLTEDEATKLVNALETQQKYWLGLLAVTASTCILLVAGKLIEEQSLSTVISVKEISVTLNLNQLLSCITSSLLYLIIVKGLGFFPGVLSLQKLRGELAISAAKRRRIEKEEEIKRQVTRETMGAPLVDATYGQLTQFPKH